MSEIKLPELPNWTKEQVLVGFTDESKNVTLADYISEFARAAIELDRASQRVTADHWKGLYEAAQLALDVQDRRASSPAVEGLQVSKFSDFIRNASDEERKAVYEEVLAKATTRQLEVLHTAKEEAAKQSGVDEDELE